MATLPGTKSDVVQPQEDVPSGDNAPILPPVSTNTPEIQPLEQPVEPSDDLQPLAQPIVPPREPDVTLHLEKNTSPGEETEEAPEDADAQFERLKQEAQVKVDREDQFEQLKREAIFRQEADTRGGIAEAVSDILLDPISDIPAIALNFLLDPVAPWEQGSNGQNLGREIQDALNGVYSLFGVEPFTAEETGLDKGIPTDGFSTLFKQPIFPSIKIRNLFVDSEEDKFFDLAPLIPQAEAEFGNVGTQERSRRFIESKEIATGAILSPMFRLFKFLEPLAPESVADASMYAKIKEFLRKQGAAQADSTLSKIPASELAPVDKTSLLNAAIDTVANISFSKGITIAKENSINSEFYQMVAGTANAAFYVGLTTRTLAGGLVELHRLAQMKFGTRGAEKRARKLLQAAVGDKEEVERILERLASEGLDADGNPVMLPGFFAALGPDLKSENQQVINVFTAFIEENADLQTARSRLHQELTDMVMEQVRTRSEHAEITEETIAKAVKALDDLIQKRIRLSMEGVAEAVANATSQVTQDEAHKMIVRAIVREMEIAENTEHHLWNAMGLRDIQVNPAPGLTRYEEILREIGATEGTGVLNLGGKEGKKDLEKFLGKLVKEKGMFNVVLGKYEPSKTVFKKGLWESGEVSMQDVQNMRSRVERAIREERVSDAPSERRIDLLEKVSKALLKTQESLTDEQLKATPNLLKQYHAARKATAVVKKRFYTGEVYEMTRIRKGGDPKAPEVAAEAIFRGAGPTKGKAGDLAIKEILNDVNGGPLRPGQELSGRALEVFQGFEELFKLRFMYHALDHNNEVVSKKALRFIGDRSEALKNFPQLKKDFEEVIRTNDTSVLEIKRYKKVSSDIRNEKVNMATVYATKGPKAFFDDYARNPSRPQKDMERDIAEAIRLANQDPTGKAREGLNGSLLQWMLDKATHRQTNNLEMPEHISGATLQKLWDSKPVQAAANMLFSKSDHEFVKQLLHSTKVLDMGVLSHAGKTGTADLKPDKMIENIMRVIILDKFPFFKGGGGSIAKQSIISKSARDLLYKTYKNPAHALIVDTFLNKNKDMLEMLFKDVNTKEDAIRAGITLNTWFQTGVLNLGVREIREAREEDEE